MPQFKEKALDAWHRSLRDGRMEIMCKAPGLRIRVLGTPEQCWQAVEMFETWTGLAIQTERRPPRKVPVPEGQLPMTELPAWDEATTPQLETDGKV